MEKYIMKAIEAYIENQEMQINLLRFECNELKEKLSAATAEIDSLTERLRGEQQC